MTFWGQKMRPIFFIGSCVYYAILCIIGPFFLLARVPILCNFMFTQRVAISTVCCLAWRFVLISPLADETRQNVAWDVNFPHWYIFLIHLCLCDLISIFSQKYILYDNIVYVFLSHTCSISMLSSVWREHKTICISCYCLKSVLFKKMFCF